MAQPANETAPWIVDAAAQLTERTDDAGVYDKLQPRLRSTVRRGVPISTDVAGVEVNTRALRLVVARSIWEVCEREIATLHFDTDGKNIDLVRIDLVGRYDDQLESVGNDVHDVAKSTLRRVLGATTGDEITIRVQWIDLDDTTP